MPLYDIKKDFSKEARWPYITIGVLFLIIMLFGTLFITSSVRSVRLRRTNDELTERLDNATNSCTELARQLSDCRGTIEQCRVYCRDIDEISERSISTAREAIEIIEETREAIGAMEVTLGLWDSDGYYNWLDSYVFDSEINND